MTGQRHQAVARRERAVLLKQSHDLEGSPHEKKDVMSRPRGLLRPGPPHGLRWLGRTR